MGQVHGSTTTTKAISRAIQHSQASLRTPAERYGSTEDGREVEDANLGCRLANWPKKTALDRALRQGRGSLLSSSGTPHCYRWMIAAATIPHLKRDWVRVRFIEMEWIGIPKSGEF
jgi:hypothetical protein